MIFEHAQYFDTFFCFYMKNDLIELRASFPLEKPIYMHWNVWVWNAFISLVSFYSHFPPLIPDMYAMESQITANSVVYSKVSSS